nr:hypothetical protein [uncultured Flavobacterium sp.]
MKLLKTILSVTLIFTFLSCGKESFDAKESYELWAFEDVPDDVEVINGQYWKSSHWTYEYITFLSLKAPKNWIDKFVKQNNLTIAKGNYSMPPEAPSWFVPKVGQKVYIEKGFSQGSMFFINEETGEVLIYDIQL